MFLGLSVIGLLEILYFLFIRIYKNYVIICTKGLQEPEKQVLERIDTILLGRHNKMTILSAADTERYYNMDLNKSKSKFSAIKY